MPKAVKELFVFNYMDWLMLQLQSILYRLAAIWG